MSALNDVQRGHLHDALEKLICFDGSRSRTTLELYPHEVDALIAELTRLANIATLHGLPSPLAQAGHRYAKIRLEER